MDVIKKVGISIVRKPIHPIIWTVLVIGVITICYLLTPDLICSDDAGISRAVAASLALKLTPMKTVLEMQSTAPGPVMLVVYGTDENERSLACWFHGSSLKGSIYLDKGVSRDDALSLVKSHGHDVGESLPVLTNPQKPYWGVTVWANGEDGRKIGRTVAVDFFTGQIR